MPASKDIVSRGTDAPSQRSSVPQQVVATELSEDSSLPSQQASLAFPSQQASSTTVAAQLVPLSLSLPSQQSSRLGRPQFSVVQQMRAPACSFSAETGALAVVSVTLDGPPQQAESGSLAGLELPGPPEQQSAPMVFFFSFRFVAYQSMLWSKSGENKCTR